MSKNVIHNFDIKIENSTAINSSEDLKNDFIKELAKVSKEMSQQKDIEQLWQESKNQETAILNNSSTSAEEGVFGMSSGVSKNPLLSNNTTSSVIEGIIQNPAVSGLSFFTAPIEGGASDTTGRISMDSYTSDSITPSIMGVENNELTSQIYSGIASQESVSIPSRILTDSDEIKSKLKKNLNADFTGDGIDLMTFNSKDFSIEKKEQHFAEQTNIHTQRKRNNLSEISETSINNVSWEKLSGLMIFKLSELWKEENDIYLKEYYDFLIRRIKTSNTNIQQLFLENEELFLLLKSIFPGLPEKIIIQTQKNVYPDLSSQKVYPEIGIEDIYFKASEVVLDKSYKENESKKDSYQNLEEQVPLVTKISTNTVQIGGKKWIDRFKFDYVLNKNEGGGEWIYNRAKKEMNASSFGAVLVLAFAIEEGGWGKGNDQSNTHNAFSLLSKKAKSKVGTAHGNVITYKNWDEGFNAFKELINNKYPSFNDLLRKDNVSADDINKALLSGNFHKLGGYTDSDKGKSILGVLKYAIIFRVYDIKEQIKTLNKENNALRINNVFEPFEDNLFNLIPKGRTPNDLELEKNNNKIKELETEKKDLETSYNKL